MTLPDDHNERLADAAGPVPAAELVVEENARLASIVRSSHHAIFGGTLDGVVTAWNRAAEHLYGHSAAEIIGRRVDELCPPESRAGEAVVLDRVARGERPEPYVARRLRRDGTTVLVRLSLWPVADDVGQIVGMACASRAARQAAAEGRPEGLRQAAAEGRPEVLRAPPVPDPSAPSGGPGGAGGAAQGPAFAESPAGPGAGDGGVARGPGFSPLPAGPGIGLSAALDKAGQTQGILPARASHELRTPLQAIMGFTGTLLLRLPGPINDEQERQLELVQESARQLLTLINQLSRPVDQ